MNKKYYVLSNDFHKSKKWLKARIIIYKAIGKTCLKCNSHKNIHIDHIKPKSKYPRSSFDLMNLQPLCSKCNKLKSNKEIVDYRSSDDIASLIDYCLHNDIDIKQFKNSHTIDAVLFNKPKSTRNWIYIHPDRSFAFKSGKKVKKKKKSNFKQLINKNRKQMVEYQLKESDSKINIDKILTLQNKNKK